jgi:uncharacterized membrane protein YdjX (TVP38/TMEM64 family)
LTTPGWERRRAARAAAGAALALGVAVAVVAHRQGLVDLDPATLRERIDALGWLAPGVFVAAACFRPFLLLPSWVLMSAGGLLFGLVGGCVFGTLGFTAGGALAFGIARALGREALAGRLSGGVARIDAYLSRRGALWIGLYTAVPITPLTAAHAAAGLSGMSAPGFVASIALALLPRTALFSYFGASLASGNLDEIALALALVAVCAVGGVQLVRRLLRP